MTTLRKYKPLLEALAALAIFPVSFYLVHLMDLILDLIGVAR